MDRLEMIQYTDPMCIWCYAMEPAIRKLQVLLGSQLLYHNVCGLLVSDVKQIIGDDELADVRFAQLKAQMKGHFLEAARCSGVPVDPSWLQEARKEDVTSLPMTLAFEAIALQDPQRADEFLWQCRANSHGRNIIMSRRENVIRLAEQYVSDKERFLKDFDGPAAREALQKDLALCKAKGVRSYPTMEFVWHGKSYLVSGYRSFDDLQAIIRSLAGDALEFNQPAFTMDNVLDFIHRYSVVSGADLKLLFNLDEKQLNALIQKLAAAKAVTVEPSAEGVFLHESSGLSCKDGVCTVF